jgi:hypothetical protein
MSQSGMSQKRVSPGSVPAAVGARPRTGPARPQPAQRQAGPGAQQARPARPTRPGGGGRGPGGPAQRTAGGGVGPLTGLGVTILLLAACVLGALLDLFLVEGPAWAVVSLYIAACGYTACRVRGADWYAALVAPPIAFGVTMILLAKLMPESFGPGLLGLAATSFALLAAKAKALYFGVAVSAAILLARRARRPRPARR